MPSINTLVRNPLGKSWYFTSCWSLPVDSTSDSWYTKYTKSGSKKRVKWVVSSGTACNWNANSYYSPFWYLTDTTIVQLNASKVKVALGSLVFGTVNSNYYSHSKAEYIEVGYVSSKDDNWLFYCSETHWEAKVAQLSGQPYHNSRLYDASLRTKKDPMVTGLFPARHRVFFYLFSKTSLQPNWFLVNLYLNSVTWTI